MPCQLLIAAKDHRKQIKGEVIRCRDEPVGTSTKQVPPNYINVRITNASQTQVEEFMEVWKTNFQHSVVVNPDLSKQVTISISQKILDVFGAIRGLKLTLKSYLENEWQAIIISWSPSSNQMVFDVPENTDLAKLKRNVLDQFQQQLGRRWLFKSADVDTVLAPPFNGFIELTKAQVQARVIDRLA